MFLVHRTLPISIWIDGFDAGRDVYRGRAIGCRSKQSPRVALTGRYAFKHYVLIRQPMTYLAGLNV